MISNLLENIMRNIYDVPRAISGSSLLKNTHQRGGMFIGTYVGGDEEITGVNTPTEIEIVLVEINSRQSPACSSAGCGLDGFGFIVRPSMGKIFPPDTEAHIVDFYRYLPLICVRISIRSIGDSDFLRDNQNAVRENQDARITLYGNVLNVEHFMSTQDMYAVEEALRVSKVCMLRVSTLSFFIPDLNKRYFCSDFVGKKEHETINGNIAYFFDKQVIQLGYDPKSAEQFAFKLVEVG